MRRKARATIPQTRNPALSASQIMWFVYEGRASWHQKRAGHTWAASTVFTGDDAEERAQRLAAGYAKHYPSMPVVVRCMLVPIR